MLRADLDQELPIAPGRLGECRDLVRGARRGGGEHDRHHREQAALGRRLAAAHLRLEGEQPHERLGAGQPADEARRGGLELEPEEQLPLEPISRARARPRRRRSPPVASAARKRTIDRPSAACARSARTARQALRLLHARRRLRHAGRRLGGAEVEQRRPPQRGRRVLLQRPAQESHRLLGRAAAVGPSRRGGQRIERPALTDGPVDGQQMGGRGLAAGGIARERAGGGQMQLHAVRPAGSSRGAPAGRSDGRSSAEAPDAGARPRSGRRPRPPPLRRSTPATSAVSARDASSPRIASARATAATAGGRALQPAGSRIGPPTAVPGRRSRRRRSLAPSSSAATS